MRGGCSTWDTISNCDDRLVSANLKHKERKGAVACSTSSVASDADRHTEKGMSVCKCPW